jgi:hypothetical protein
MDNEFFVLVPMLLRGNLVASLLFLKNKQCCSRRQGFSTRFAQTKRHKYFIFLSGVISTEKMMKHPSSGEIFAVPIIKIFSVLTNIPNLGKFVISWISLWGQRCPHAPRQGATNLHNKFV